MQIFKSLLEDLSVVLKKNKWIVWCALGIIVALVAFFMIMGGVSSLARSRSNGRASATTQETGQAADTSALSGGFAVDPGVKLTDAQQAAIDSYTSEERSIIEELVSLPWFTPSNEKVTIGDTSFTFAGAAPKSYAITAVKVGEKRTESAADNVTVTNTVQDTNFSIIDGDGKTSLCTFTGRTGPAGTTRTLDGTPFVNGSTLTAYQSASELDLELPDELSSAIGGDKDGLLAAVRKWATDNAPAASLARWDQRLTNDYQSKTVSFTLTLNDTSTTKVKVTYRTDLKTFAISEGGE